MSWGREFPGSSAEDTHCLGKKKKVLLFILRLLTAILCNICCFLFQGGVCELSWEMMISGVDGVLGQGPSFLTLPGPSAERHQWVGEGGSPPPCLKKKNKQPCLALAICPLPWVLLVPLCGVGRSEVVVRGDTPPSCRHWDTLERPPLKEKKKNPS